MVANHKPQDGENELVTVDRIEPVFVGRNHLYPDMWIAVGLLFDDPLRMVIKTHDRRKFLDAGYIPADIFKNVVTHVSINVITAWAAGQGLYIGEVLPATETVHSEIERQAAWKMDVVKFGGFKWDGDNVATFARLGERVVWVKNAAGQYTRTEGNVNTVYEAKSIAPTNSTINQDIARITALLAANGITPKRPVIEAKGAAKRGGNQPSFAIVLEEGQRLPAALWAVVEPGAWCSGNYFVVQLKTIKE